MSVKMKSEEKVKPWSRRFYMKRRYFNKRQPQKRKEEKRVGQKIGVEETSNLIFHPK
jgi:hypothetical protein